MRNRKIVCVIAMIIAVSGIIAGCDSDKNVSTKETKETIVKDNANKDDDYEKYFVFNGNSILLLMEDYKECKKIVIPEKCERIEAMVFHGNENIEEISFQSNKNVEGDEWEFWGCSNLKKAELPDEQVKINDYMFCECENLSSFIIPKATEIIGEYAFSECNSLKEVEIGESVKTIGKWAFRYDENLENVIFNNKLETIDEYAFENCKSLKEIKLNEGVKRIESMAFTNCDSLTDIYLPESIEYIDGTAFAQLNPHEATVYVKQGSYADKSFDEDWGDDGLFIKKYY